MHTQFWYFWTKKNLATLLLTPQLRYIHIHTFIHQYLCVQLLFWEVEYVQETMLQKIIAHSFLEFFSQLFAAQFVEHAHLSNCFHLRLTTPHLLH
jgi:hypothetical protein